MTKQKHPITPPPELVAQWWGGTHGAFYEFEAITAKVAQWGADQELEACCAWVTERTDSYGFKLRAARRPKNPSLKDQALSDVDEILKNASSPLRSDFDRILAALKELPDPS